VNALFYTISVLHSQVLTFDVQVKNINKPFKQKLRISTHPGVTTYGAWWISVLRKHMKDYWSLRGDHNGSPNRQQEAPVHQLALQYRCLPNYFT